MWSSLRWLRYRITGSFLREEFFSLSLAWVRKKIAAVPIAGVDARPEGMVWSGDGSAAVLYSRTGKWFQSIAGFPAAPVAQSLVDVSPLGGSFLAIAVDAPGKQISVAVNGDAAGVYQANSGQGFTSLVSLAQPIALSVLKRWKRHYMLWMQVPSR